MQTSYRPHNAGHDYYEAGTYLITLVVSGRQRLLSTLGNDPRNPTLALSQVGAIVGEEWEKTAVIQQSRGRLIETHCQVCMPDHWHGVIVVKERMDKSLGYVIQCFKSACTARWRREVTGYADSTSSSNRIRSMGTKKRAAYYATQPLIARPLFDDDYDDTICLNERHRQAMIHYVNDNPRRAILRRANPLFMQRCLHVVLDGQDYAAFGNLFLLRWARKVQVFCHRKARLSQLDHGERFVHRYPDTSVSPDTFVTSIPYEQTHAYRREHDAWVQQVLQGATVIVTPGISRGELLMKNECLQSGYPLIHLQKEPIGALWKPEQQRFEACVQGRLLILAPWSPETLGDHNGVPASTDYAQFHNLNTLAQRICEFEGEAKIGAV